MAIGIAILVLILFVFPAIITMVAMIDLLSHDGSTWDRSGESRLAWGLVVTFVALIGPVLYLTLGQPRLQAAGPVASIHSTEL